jgi:tetratricopeptide (TPR) repeat protein
MPTTASPSPFLANTLIRIALTLLLSCMVAPASANKPNNITDAEMALIPKYCPDTMGFNYGDAYYNTSPRASGWVALMGKNFWAVHHYCWALINLSRANHPGLPAEIRKGTLEGVRSDYQYVLEHSTPDFILLPEIYTRTGEVELLLARPNKASEAFARARELKPNYWPAYSRWADVLIHSGKRAEAKELVKSGLEYAPTAKVLLEQYRLLGGKPSDIVPKPIPATPDPEADTATKPDAAQGTEGSTSAITDTTKPNDSPK